MGGFLLVSLSGRHMLVLVLLFASSVQLYSNHPWMMHAQSLTSWAGSDHYCNLYEGSWVRAPFEEGDCPIDLVPLNRQCSNKHDKEYLNYKWQPTNCDLPLFDVNGFLGKYKGKTVMFVGDSIAQNQWMSLACLIFKHYWSYTRSYIKNHQQKVIAINIFFHEPAVSIVYQQNRFLVDMVGESDTNNGPVIMLDSISSEITQLWSTADLLVVNSYHWWTHSGSIQPWKYLEIDGMKYSTMDHMSAYGRALNTWAKWVDKNIDPQKTRVFFQGISALHLNYWTPNGEKRENCLGEREPIKGSTFLGMPYPGEVILERVLTTIKKPVTFMNITLMTQLRPDAHPEFYDNTVDCSHYCVRGIPDVWNQLMYASL